MYQKVVIYGLNRVGKTSMACEWPKPLLLVSFEPGRTGGATSVSKLSGVTMLQVASTEESFALANELKVDTGYKSVVIDSVSSLQEVILRELMGWETEKTQLSFGGVPEEVYRARSEKVRDCLAPYLNLAKHTVVVAHEKDHNPDKTQRNKLTRGLQLKSFVAPAVGGATVEWLETNCGYICRLYVAPEVRVERSPSGIKDAEGKDVVNETEIETGEMIHRLLCKPQEQFAAGFRSPAVDGGVSWVPKWIESGKGPRDLYNQMQKVIRGEKLS